jgi:hypothetical protein
MTAAIIAALAGPRPNRATTIRAHAAFAVAKEATLVQWPPAMAASPPATTAKSLPLPRARCTRLRHREPERDDRQADPAVVTGTGTISVQQNPAKGKGRSASVRPL